MHPMVAAGPFKVMAAKYKALLVDLTVKVSICHAVLMYRHAAPGCCNEMGLMQWMASPCGLSCHE